MSKWETLSPQLERYQQLEKNNSQAAISHPASKININLAASFKSLFSNFYILTVL